MRLRQINLNKCKLANIQLCQLLKRDMHTVYLITEPYFYKQKIPGLPKGYCFFGSYNSRAIIIAPLRMPLFLCHELSHPDFTVCLYDDGKDKKYLASIYLDILKNVSSDNLVNIFEIIQDVEVPAIFGLDSNAHSTFWGCAESNSRGIEMENLIIHYNLSVMNVGIEPTWQRDNLSSIIDITLTMGSNPDVKGWHITPHILHSDHKMLELYFLDKKISPTMIEKVNWEQFKKNLQIGVCYYNEWTPVTIETEAAALTKAMHDAIKKSSFSTKLKPKDDLWWNDALYVQSKKVDKLARVQLSTPNAANKARYLAEKKLLMKNIRKSKRQTWQNFCNSINDPNTMAIFNKIVKGGRQPKIGLLKKADGTFARDINESISVLMASHFPKSVEIPKRDETNLCQSRYYQRNNRFCTASDLEDTFITSERVSAAIKSFGSFKAPGEDNLKPCVLKEFIKNENGLSRLTMLFKAIVTLGYTPNAWCSAKVIFIPKLGKSDYSEPRSFRPISLLSFLFKTVERLVFWELEHKVLKIHPLSKNQHAFRKGYSTESALSSLINDIEQSVYNSGTALIASLDCQGAFDSLLYSDIAKALRKRNTPDHIINWYDSFLHARRANVSFNDKSSCFKLKLGCAQGGILSPIIWNITFESFIKIFKNSHVKLHIYADDACLCISGPDLSAQVDLMQDALDKCHDWGTKHGLIFVPEKTATIFFHNKQKIKEPKKLKMNGIEINYSSTIKYLGIWLDQRLTWSYHINERIKKARGLFIKVRNAVGSYWGPSAKALKWAINGVIAPMITYGSIVFSRVSHLKTVQDKLRKLHRFMMSAMAPIRRSTPTQGLEIIYNMSPLHLKIRENALRGILRVLPITKPSNLLWTGKTKQGHLFNGKNELKNLGITKYNFDTVKENNLWRKFEVNYDSFKSGLPNNECSVKCYTDGSKFNGNTGFGYTIIENSTEIINDNGYLGRQSTVFQAEILAIQKCAEYIALEPFPEVIIYSDSQAALAALTSLKITHKTVQNCISALNEASNHMKVTLAWVKAHADHPGNERADSLAKKGTTNTNNTVEIPPPFILAKSKIEVHIHKTWNEEWWLYKDADQTKEWFPALNKRISFELIRLPRAELGNMVQLLTGHNRLKYHQSKIDPSKDPKCSKCKVGKETTRHLMGDCPMIQNWRHEIFGYHFLEKYPVWNLTQFTSLMRKAKIDELNKGEGFVLTHR